MSVSVERSKRGRHGCFLPVVHSFCPMLAHRAVRASDLSFGLAVDAATAYFRHRCSRSSGLDQRAIFSPSEAASRTTRDLTCRCLLMDYLGVNGRITH